MEWLNIYGDLLRNIFFFLTLDLFLAHFANYKNKKTLNKIKFAYLCYSFIISFIPNIPYFSIIALVIDFIYISLMTNGTSLSHLFTLVKFYAYYSLTFFMVIILHTLITLDTPIYVSNETYAVYSDIIDIVLVYLVLCTYVITRKLSNYRNGKTYKRYFLSMVGILVLLLLVCSMLLGSNVLAQEDVLPFIFLLLLGISMLCLNTYRKVITILDENALAKIEIEKNKLLQDYYASVEENLKTLSILRHDFKNHLIIIQGYASSGQTDKLLSYIQPLYEESSSVSLIKTTNTVLSSLVNAKREDCRMQNIDFVFEQQFSTINMDDFHLVSLLSNLLDNAITAAAKCPHGFIKLAITEVKNYIQIECTNNHQEQIQQKNNIFFTTKATQKEIHGLGIKSMRKTVEKLRGEIHIDYTEDSFHVSILVPNYK